METINTMAKAAATAVWGEPKPGSHQEEPISGELGDTTKGEPFDKGNYEEAGDDTHYTTSSNKDAAEGGSSSAAFAKSSGLAAESDQVPRNPSSDLKERKDGAAAGDSTKGQNDVRDPSDPATHPRNAASDVDNTSGAGTGTAGGEEDIKEPQKLEGPGPAPLEEVARKHGGDAGNSNPSVDKSAPGSGGGAADAAEDEDEDGPHAKSKGEGTGEQYVKSTGLHADGGDFDATKPGAGREADRLLEEKGVSREIPGDKSHVSPTQSPDSSKSDNSSEKKSLKDKIKDKLHRH